MVTLELLRLILSPKINSIILEKRQISDTDINNYLVKEFGDDNNGGITNALAYVDQKYGGGKYQLKIYQSNCYVNSHNFELSGSPKVAKDPYISPFTGKVC